LELPNDSSPLKGSIYFAIRGKKEWQNNLSRAIAVDDEVDTTSLKCEYNLPKC